MKLFKVKNKKNFNLNIRVNIFKGRSLYFNVYIRHLITYTINTFNFKLRDQYAKRESKVF